MSEAEPGHEGEPSYLKEMLFSQTNINALLCTLAGSALLAVPFGWAGVALPLVFFTGPNDPRMIGLEFTVRR